MLVEVLELERNFSLLGRNSKSVQSQSSAPQSVHLHVFPFIPFLAHLFAMKARATHLAPCSAHYNAMFSRCSKLRNMFGDLSTQKPTRLRL